MKMSWNQFIFLISLVIIFHFFTQTSFALVKSSSNTGGNTQTGDGDQSLTTGDASAKSSQTNINGETTNQLEACANGVCVTAQPTGPGSFSVEVNTGGQTQINQNTTTKSAQIEVKKTEEKKDDLNKNLIGRIRQFISQFFNSVRLKFFQQ